MLDIPKFRCTRLSCKNPSVALFSLLMELYHALTPTYSGNHKASLEGFLGGAVEIFLRVSPGSSLFEPT